MTVLGESLEEKGLFEPPSLGLENLKGLVEKHFGILDAQFYGSLPSFIIEKEGRMKESFEHLYKDLKPLGLMPILRHGVDAPILRIYKFPGEPSSRILLSLSLFLLTLVGITWFGFMLTDTPLLDEFQPSFPRPIMVALYVLSMLAIFGLHELGHEIACRVRGIKASPPYFIPGLVGGTFGAIIVIKEPPANKDTLFDIGFSGPLLGILASILVASVGILTSPLVPTSHIRRIEALYPGIAFEEIPVPIIFTLLMDLLRTPPSSAEAFSLILNPMAYAGWIGFIVNFLNLLPAWQLDGGRVFSSLIGEKRQKYVTWLSIIVMLLLGFWPMALLIALLSRKTVSIECLDGISSLSPARKVLVALTIPILILMAVRLPLFGL
ncbi:site-2 protease family protein [Candidatus Bathyarchaeota archaeon]|nr:site-2 protease family protein [Candidatus Bathyarchaeota archaeon]MBS7628010.1 site-2 protease family protein [Candidatus Bathyarchaeota archaeon]